LADAMSIGPGTRIGTYEVTGPLGAGGMGEVFRARDTALGRDVALKILPEAFATDPDRLMRFEREARTLASLNHPHIAQVYGVEQAAAGPGFGRAIVMELVDGEDLSQRIARGALPFDEAVPIARQIAEALEAAHDAGIIHRDLKPANIKVRADGTVKVLDFGLAKAGGAGEAGRTGGAGVLDSPTITSPAVTMHGVILGTAAYMAPEQAKGKPVDKRADIWAFGAVFYEMLTGQRAFAGEDITDTIVAVVSREPDWTRLPDATPPAIALLLRRCLEKNVQKRLPHIGVVRLEFDAVGTTPPPSGRGVAGGPAFRGAHIAALVGVATIAAALAGAATWTWARASTGGPAALYRSSLLIPADQNLSAMPPTNRFAISPDGRHLAYIGTDGEEQHLYIRPLDSLVAQVVPRSTGAASPFWSPDSREVAFFAGGSLYAVSSGGGVPRPIAEVRGGGVTVAGSWSPNGTIAVSLSGRIGSIPASGGPLTPLLEPDRSAGEDQLGFPHFLPDGRRFLFVGYKGLTAVAVYLSSLDTTSTRTRLMEGGSNVQYANGHLLYMRTNVLVAQPFDLESATLQGEAVTVDESVMPNVAAPFGGAFSVSHRGALVYEQTRAGQGAAAGDLLVWRTRAGEEHPLFSETGSYRSLSVARTRPQAIVGRFDGRGSDLWLVDLTRGVRTRFTFGRENSGVWMPDGSAVIYNSGREGRLSLFRKRLDADAAEEPVDAGQEDWPLTPLSVSPDGKVLLYGVAHPETSNDLWLVRLDGSASPAPFLASKFQERWGEFSPDGRWIVYESDESGRREIYVRLFGGGGTVTQVSPAGGGYPRWSRDGREIYFVSAGRLFAASVRASATGVAVASVDPLFDVRPPSGFRRHFYDVGPDGRFLMMTETAPPGPTQLTLALNWSALAQRAQ
jgi:Tol biopolymer transport system component